MPKTKLTVRAIEATTPDAAGDVFLWDTDVRNFGLRVKPSGAKSYFVQYRRGRRTRRLTFGNPNTMQPEKARKRARALLSQVDDGRDPSHERHVRNKAATVADLAKRFLTDYVPLHTKPRTAKEYRRLIERVAVPEIGKLATTDVDDNDISKLMYSRRSTPVDANRLLSRLDTMFKFAEAIKVRPRGSNPCRGVKRYKEKARERYLSADEMAALGDTLAEAEREQTESVAAIAAVRLLLLTGCRMSEIMTLRWSYVDFQGQCLRLPDSKTDAKRVQLSAPALAVLAEIKRGDGPFVIVGRKKGAHLTDLEKPWRRIRGRATIKLWETGSDPTAAALVAKAREIIGRRNSPLTHDECREAAKAEGVELPPGLSDVRLHDLRHSYASIAVGLGEGLPMIGKLLGHKHVATTARYAHLATDPVKAATEKVGAAVAGMIAGTKAETVDLARARAARKG